MIDVTHSLQARMKADGCTLKMKNDGSVVKFVLENVKRKYRGFIYVKKTDERNRDVSLKDLYNNYYYENNIAVIANT